MKNPHYLIFILFLACNKPQAEQPLQLTALAYIPPQSQVELLYKSTNPVKDAKRLTKERGKPVGTRISAFYDGTGVAELNAVPADMPINCNVLWKRSDMPRNDSELNVYKQGVINNFYKQVTHSLRLINLQNEAISSNPSYTVAMMAKMVKLHYDICKRRGVLVSASGNTMPITATLTKRYLLIKGDYIGYSNFTKAYGDLPYAPEWMADTALAEMRAFVSLGISDGFVYTLHFNTHYSNVEGLPYMLAAMKYFTDNRWPIVINELSMHYQDPLLVKRAMDLAIGGGVKLIVGYSGSNTWSLPYTTQMDSVFISY